MSNKKKHDENPKILTFTFSSVGKKSFMDIDRPVGAWINLSISEPGVVHIDGNSKGYIYLGKFLIAMGIRNPDKPAIEGYHVHLRAEYGDLDLEGKKGEIQEILLTNIDDPK